MSALDELLGHARETVALGEAAGLLGWDQETMMPRGAADQRAEMLAALEGAVHARRADPRVGALLAELSDAALDPVSAAQLRIVRREHHRATRVPASLAAEIARVTSLSQGHWAEARRNEDVAAFLPWLAQVVALKREEAAALAETGGALYDALLDGFEPGARAAEVEVIFAQMRPRLVALRDRAMAAPAPAEPLAGHFAEEAQRCLAMRLAGAFGYDWTRGRLDLAVHPFSSGGGDDVRITTRVDPRDPFNCLYSTLHETGHAVYEQSIASSLRLTPAGRGASMAIHESQARLFENQLGRSRAFTSWLFSAMAEAFGDFRIGDPETFYRSVNRLEPGFIRTEADEVQYNLHVMLRFDLERAMIAGALEVADIEAAWNERFAADFGRAVPVPSKGLLQDVHWSVGLFGYFPTYALGNVYAGQLFAALREGVPDLDTHLRAGDPGPAVAWLRERLHRHGSLHEPGLLMGKVLGQDMPVAPDPEPLLAYLETKFSDIYGFAG